MNSEGSIDMVGDLPPTVIVHDMSFDWTGRRLAAACSDKTIRMFAKRGDKWSEENSIKIQGASAWKVKWARPEFGTIIATCSLDTQIRIYELKKIERG
jgi:WD40 repeat protein